MTEGVRRPPCPNPPAWHDRLAGRETERERESGGGQVAAAERAERFEAIGGDVKFA